MSRIFLSHSSKNSDSAVALRDWLATQGWDDVFLDLDPRRGIAAGERWERALSQAALRCEAVLFLVSREWLASDWCLKEFNLANRLNKRLFGLLIEDIPVGELPATLTGTWQLVPLASGRDHVMLRVVLPGIQSESHVTFSREGLTRLRIGLERAGLDARFFAWPPEDDPQRPPYRGLLPLEAADAGIFFGREAPTVEALDRIRGIRDGTGPRLVVLIGASGAGKSSFLRAGLLPRLGRDDRNYVVLPVIRPELAAIKGKAGLLRSLESAFAACSPARTRAEIRAAIEGGAATLRPLLEYLVGRAKASLMMDDGNAKTPTLVLAIDQGEELFLSGSAPEGTALLELLRDLMIVDAPALLVIITIRSDAYEKLQTAKAIEGITQHPLSLAPMPRGAYQAVIEGPIARLRETNRSLTIEPALTQALLSDIEDGGGRDALPLLAFSLERLYLEYGSRGRLTLSDYDALGRIKGSIEAAIDHVFTAADADAQIPRDREARLALLRLGLIPWLAGIDPDTGSPRRQKAPMSEIPQAARPLINLLVEQRLLSTDVSEDDREQTVEPAHEALLRQWSLLQGWLQEDFAALTNLESVRRAARDWDANNRAEDWLAHRAGRLDGAERLLLRKDLAAKLDTVDRDYLEACKDKTSALRRTRLLTFGSLALLSLIIALGGPSIYSAYTKQRLIKQEAARTDIVGSILATATVAGGTAYDKADGRKTSPYTTPLVENLRQKDKSITEAIQATHGAVLSLTAGYPQGQQRPLLSTDMNGPIYLWQQPESRAKAAVVFSDDGTAFSLLDAPQYDADSVHKVLMEAGFDEKNVFRLRNPTGAEIGEAMSRACDRLKKSEGAERAPDSAPQKGFARLRSPVNSLLVFYFSGHGAQINGENFLIAAFAKQSRIDSPENLQRVSVSVSEIQQRLSGCAAATVLILDTHFPDHFKRAR